MEALLITLFVAVLAAVGYLICIVKVRQNQALDINGQLAQMDLNVRNAVLEQLSGLNQNLQQNFEQGRNELSQIQAKNLTATQDYMQRVMGVVDNKLEKVGQGLGEISKVGSFMQLLFNPSARGRVGEVQLEGLLTGILAPTQFERNFKPFHDQAINVEFAVRMPTDLGEDMFLPIDSKFPKEEYERLCAATAKDDIDRCQRALRTKVKDFARQISKYINTPRTTDMAVMYLPDGIFDWVASQSDLVNEIREEYKVVVTGPSTLWMMLSFVSYFFRLMFINDKSKEVWGILSGFKKQIEKTVELIDKTASYSQKVVDGLDELKGTRYKMIMRQLKDIDEETGAADLGDSEKAA